LSIVAWCTDDDVTLFDIDSSAERVARLKCCRCQFRLQYPGEALSCKHVGGARIDSALIVARSADDEVVFVHCDRVTEAVTVLSICDRRPEDADLVLRDDLGQRGMRGG